MNTTSQTLAHRFEPNLQLAWGQMIVIAAMGAVAIAVLDFFKFALERSFIRLACVWVGAFVVALGLFWFRSGRHGCQTVVLDETSLTLETSNKREVLPWSELSEIILVGDSVLKFKSRNAREPIRLENTGFNREQWDSIKKILQSRGYQFKTGYSAL